MDLNVIKEEPIENQVLAFDPDEIIVIDDEENYDENEDNAYPEIKTETDTPNNENVQINGSAKKSARISKQPTAQVVERRTGTISVENFRRHQNAEHTVPLPTTLCFKSITNDTDQTVSEIVHDTAGFTRVMVYAANRDDLARSMNQMVVNDFKMDEEAEQAISDEDAPVVPEPLRNTGFIIQNAVPQPGPSNVNPLYCTFCKFQYASKRSLYSHNKTQKHILSVAMQNRKKNN
ncbi:uncharacterized protein LOC116343067 [Contarinia nasturtii]|uniref:uncharacterized protein LOC116343067 n=1 Tax=Contarinia nasturtii TaxID=265458 RepID=UPI0012D491AA|nr:uncharacterized protein LOC116343067 [Contarinia nasturtii]